MIRRLTLISALVLVLAQSATFADAGGFDQFGYNRGARIFVGAADGGYCVWGQFAVILSQGTIGGVHIWDALASPAGYGAYR